MRTKDHWLLLVARALLAFIFIASGLSKIPGWEQTSQYMASRGFPLVPLFLFPAIFIEVIGGLALLIGFRTKIAAGVLALFLIPTTLIFHNFWAFDGMERQMQLTNFLKNLAIMGGLGAFAAFGAGIFSVDHRLNLRSTIPFQRNRETINRAS